MSIRAILVDMDGTLLGKSQVAISVRNMKVIQQALQQGIAVIPCTGRVYDMLPPQLLTQEGLRYFVTSHGARVYDRETGRVVMVFNRNDAEGPEPMILRGLAKRTVHVTVSEDGHITIEGMESSWLNGVVPTKEDGKLDASNPRISSGEYWLNTIN